MHNNRLTVAVFAQSKKGSLALSLLRSVEPAWAERVNHTCSWRVAAGMRGRAKG